MALNWLLVTTILIAATSGMFAAFRSAQPRIVGGQDAASGFFPYQAAIKHSDGNFLCNGVIINSTLILTTAHCLDRISASSLMVLVGTYRLNVGGTSYAVSSIRRHKSYNSFTLKNDIAILKLTTGIEFTNEVFATVLGTNYVGANVDCILSAWGFTQVSGSESNYLQYIFLKTLSINECAQKLGADVDDSQLCTFTKAGEGACYKDTGGPLVSDGYLVGIVSSGRPCAIGYPDVYTRISHFYNWIMENSY